ncbi:uncharacterized protein K02A2.6-like [Mya arenaria]|uniref:uncharacterized protein K02A2.6-like n=1 Tax=Mya arenaria TaxID=6604 RepID=UPI0022DEF8EA|nr:uncharacterized protein K02A2.6-like [Mya arenaria]
MAQGLPVFPSFNVTETAVDSRWKKWLGRLEIMLVDVEETFDAAKQALTKYFAPKKSIEFEVYKFRQAKQEPHENLDSFHTRLRKLGEHCEFANTDKEIKSQIIQGKSENQTIVNNDSLPTLTVSHNRKHEAAETVVEIELKRLEDMDIIEKVDGPTDSVSPIVVAPKPKSKNNEIRLEGVQNISDDIIVYGNSQEQHDSRLAAALRRLQEKGLTQNKQKCEFNKKTLEFFGYIFSENGFSADKKKCEIIKNTPAPQNASEVRSFLAMTNYVSRFIPNYSSTTEPFRMLVKKDVKFVWEERQQNAFDKLKSDLSSETVMTYFDPKLTTQIVADASPVGIAAIMLQGGKVVSYASKSLTDTEKRYSQTEKGNLAIVWAIEHWHIYLFGNKFTVITDAKALEHIYKNPKSKPPARLERWRMKMQAYDFDVIYKPGESNMSDYLTTDKNSREPLQMTEMPKQAWDSVSMDFCGPFPDRKYLLVLIDDFSRFPIVEIITSLNVKSVIEKLDKIFSEYGIPEVLRTDNGPPMNSADFQNFSKQFSFKHRKITPIWPQANGECERFMKTIGKVIRAAKTQKADWHTDMYAFILNYRATKHATTKYSPAELLFGRQIRIKLPFAPSKPSKKNVQVKARENDAYQKAKMKSYADAKRHAKPATYSVLVKQHKTNKFSFKSITRNSSFFKLIRLQDSDSEDDFDDFYRPGTVRTDEQEPSQPRRSSRNQNPPERFKTL